MPQQRLFTKKPLLTYIQKTAVEWEHKGKC
jgi:hypothetical protein